MELAIYGSLPAVGAVVVDKQGEADRTANPVQTTHFEVTTEALIA